MQCRIGPSRNHLPYEKSWLEVNFNRLMNEKIKVFKKKSERENSFFSIVLVPINYNFSFRNLTQMN